MEKITKYALIKKVNIGQKNEYGKTIDIYENEKEAVKEADKLNASWDTSAYSVKSKLVTKR